VLCKTYVIPEVQEVLRATPAYSNPYLSCAWVLPVPTDSRAGPGIAPNGGGIHDLRRLSPCQTAISAFLRPPPMTASERIP
jgi:hypothetical protein